jgi:hypothetical protein
MAPTMLTAKDLFFPGDVQHLWSRRLDAPRGRAVSTSGDAMSNIDATRLP